jgi:hypothetical protein
VKRVLVVGVPRSGTTWVAHVLGQTSEAAFLDEPDNHLAFPFALRAKRRLRGGFHPALAPDEPAAEYELLWRRALDVGDGRAGAYRAWERLRRTASTRLLRSASQAQKWAAFDETVRLPLRLRAAEELAIPERPERRLDNLIVKSVYASLSLEWITARFPVQTVIVLRAPLNVLSSWARIGWLGRPGDDMLDTLGADIQERLSHRWHVEAPPVGSSIFARAAWLIGALTSELARAAERDPSCLTVVHEHLCEQPHERLRLLAEQCGLRWSAAVDHALDDLNRPGTGYELRRVAKDLPDAWRSRLDPDRIGEALAVLERFPLDERLLPSDR